MFTGSHLGEDGPGLRYARAMPSLPQTGGCLCGDVRYSLREDPVTVYACHCTDCQTETGSAVYLAVVVPAAALAYTRGKPVPWQVALADGRSKGSDHCERCKTKIGAASKVTGLASIDGGTFDDTSWIDPVAHIWTRSAQPWIRLPQRAMLLPQQPSDEDFVAMARAWKERPRPPS